MPFPDKRNPKIFWVSRFYPFLYAKHQNGNTRKCNPVATIPARPTLHDVCCFVCTGWYRPTIPKVHYSEDPVWVRVRA